MTKLEDLIERKGSIALGGGQARIEKQHEQGKMTARERLETCSIPTPLLRSMPSLSIAATTLARKSSTSPVMVLLAATAR